MASQREDSITQYKNGGREDLANVEMGELEIIKTFIPKQPTDEELALYVTEVIKDYLSVKGGNLSMKDMKSILDIVKQKYASVNGRIVSKTLQKYIV